MAAYNVWMNQRLYAVCAEMPDELRKRNLGAFFKSIHGTLNHLLYGDRAWLGRFTQQAYGVTDPSAELYTNFDELRLQREATDARILDWSNGLQDAWLVQDFTFTSNIDGGSRTLPAWVLVTHMFNHQTHHRGQLTTLIKQAGYEPGPTDIPWMPEFPV